MVIQMSLLYAIRRRLLPEILVYEFESRSQTCFLVPAQLQSRSELQNGLDLRSRACCILNKHLKQGREGCISFGSAARNVRASLDSRFLYLA